MATRRTRSSTEVSSESEGTETQTMTEESPTEETSPEAAEAVEGTSEETPPLVQTGAGTYSSIPLAGIEDPNRFLYQTRQFDQGADKSASVLSALAYPSQSALEAEEVSLKRIASTTVDNPTEVVVGMTENRDRIRDEDDTACISNTEVPAQES